MQDVNNHWFDAPNWSSAAEFTRQHEEEIRQVQEEVKGMSELLSKRHCLEHVECIRRRCWQARTLAARQAALAELKKGWKA